MNIFQGTDVSLIQVKCLKILKLYTRISQKETFKEASDWQRNYFSRVRCLRIFLWSFQFREGWVCNGHQILKKTQVPMWNGCGVGSKHSGWIVSIVVPSLVCSTQKIHLFEYLWEFKNCCGLGKEEIFSQGSHLKTLVW